MILDLVWPGPGQRHARGAGLLAALARRPPGGPPLLPRQRLAPGQIIGAGRHRGVAAVAGHDPLQPRHLRPQVLDLLLLRRDLLALRRDHRVPGRARLASRCRRRQIGHK
jgi:hypothetical protein